MLRTLDVTTSFLASGARLASGMRVGPLGPRPELPLELYEFEACPFCRKVREALSILDLDAHIRPCPKNGPRFRPHVVERGGKAQFPYLVDPNTGKEMYESDDILRYLFERYGDGGVPLALAAGPFTLASAAAAGFLRPGFGPICVWCCSITGVSAERRSGTPLPSAVSTRIAPSSFTFSNGARCRKSWSYAGEAARV